jgi:hypothetical protein
MACAFCANSLIAWVFNVATAVADLNIDYASKLHKAGI